MTYNHQFIIASIPSSSSTNSVHLWRKPVILSFLLFGYLIILLTSERLGLLLGAMFDSRCWSGEDIASQRAIGWMPLRVPIWRRWHSGSVVIRITRQQSLICEDHNMLPECAIFWAYNVCSHHHSPWLSTGQSHYRQRPHGCRFANLQHQFEMDLQQDHRNLALRRPVIQRPQLMWLFLRSSCVILPFIYWWHSSSACWLLGTAHFCTMSSQYNSWFEAALLTYASDDSPTFFGYCLVLVKRYQSWHQADS